MERGFAYDSLWFHRHRLTTGASNDLTIVRERGSSDQSESVTTPFTSPAEMPALTKPKLYQLVAKLLIDGLLLRRKPPRPANGPEDKRLKKHACTLSRPHRRIHLLLRDRAGSLGKLANPGMQISESLCFARTRKGRLQTLHPNKGRESWPIRGGGRRRALGRKS